MRRVGAAERAPQTFQRSLAAVLFLCATSSGCDHACVAFISDPSGGSISLQTSTCSFNTKTSGIVRVRLSASPTLVASWRTAGVQHIFASFQGIEAHLRPVATEAPEGWVELAPSLSKQPLQVDLMTGNEDSSPSIPVGEAAIPSARYTEVRLLLVLDGPATVEPLPEKSICVGVGFNCFITADGSVHPLILAGGGSQILIPSTRINGGMFYVLGDTTTNLDLEFSPDSSAGFAPNRAVWLNPVFNVQSEFSPDSREGSEPSFE
jgi:Domain of unknown function (DUF4382)